jgi:hypothetical protein
VRAWPRLAGGASAGNGPRLTGAGGRSATDEAELGARGEGSGWERKIGEKEPLPSGPEATVPCSRVKFDSNSNFK